MQGLGRPDIVHTGSWVYIVNAGSGESRYSECRVRGESRYNECRVLGARVYIVNAGSRVYIVNAGSRGPGFI
ncbi:unnamed protein product [Staurois parvus]|uniref:Uncharacterized protein n=1 Tax=Staurois parvus TaxID=386267 RepID=A0ABN9CQ11_9NEOB|nr:unnamed protein product [Staurois parvus]